MATEDPTAEQWLPVVGYEGWYEVSNFGRVRGCKRTIASGWPGAKTVLQSKLLCPYPVGKGAKAGEGYPAVGLSRNGKRKMIQIHRLVLSAFLREPIDGEQGNHQDLNKTNNRIDNLEWVTCSENIIHAARAGRKSIKLSTEDVVAIREKLSCGCTQCEVAEIFGVDQSMISRIASGEYWFYV